MSNTATFCLRMDDEVKKESEKIFSELGMNLTTAINVFLRKSIQTGGFPFDVRLDNYKSEVAAAVKESYAIEDDIRAGKRKPFDSWADAKTELMK